MINFYHWHKFKIIASYTLEKKTNQKKLKKLTTTLLAHFSKILEDNPLTDEKCLLISFYNYSQCSYVSTHSLTLSQASSRFYFELMSFTIRLKNKRSQIFFTSLVVIIL